MNHVMIDLETWGFRPGCAIRSIGAVFFDPYTDAIGGSFYKNVTDASCKLSNLYFDPDTVKWWSEQSAEASAVFLTDQVDLLTAVRLFNHWFYSYGAEFIWSHSAAFDLPIYEVAANSVGFNSPWNYHATRDTRTLFELVGLSTKDLPFNGTLHYALDDAIHQARCVQLAKQKIDRWRWS